MMGRVVREGDEEIGANGEASKFTTSDDQITQIVAQEFLFSLSTAAEIIQLAAHIIGFLARLLLSLATRKLEPRSLHRTDLVEATFIRRDFCYKKQLSSPKIFLNKIRINLAWKILLQSWIITSLFFRHNLSNGKKKKEISDEEAEGLSGWGAEKEKSQKVGKNSYRPETRAGRGQKCSNNEEEVKGRKLLIKKKR
jgi:hypothetical protein